MGKKKSGKSVSTIPKEFLPYAREGLDYASGTLADPLKRIPEIQGGLGITPGYQTSPISQYAAGSTVGALPNVAGLFNRAGSQQRATIGGGYLDPTNTSAYRNLASSLFSGGQETFQKLLDQARQGGAMSGAFRSSAREGQEINAARGVSSDIQRALAEAGTGLYSQERALQEGASQGAQSLYPNIANMAFGQGQDLAGNQLKDLYSRLTAAQGAQGLRDTGLQQIISTLGALGGVREGGGGGGGLPGLGLVSALLS